MAVRLISLFLTSLICRIAAAPPKWGIPPLRIPPLPPFFRPPPFRAPPFVPPVDDSPPWWNIPPAPDGDDVPPGEDPPAPPSGGGGGGGSCSCSCSFSSGPPPPPPPLNVIIVGGDKKWQYGVNYTDWLNNAGDIFVGDVLEFDYAAPNKQKRKHTVYSLNNYWSFKTCNLSDSIMLGNELAGSGPGGFRLLLGMKPTGSDPVHYFACGEGNGDHCNNGMMKFALKPIQRDNNPH